MQARQTGAKRPAPRRGTEAGFTLLELLVVIAIIAILAALLVEGLAAALRAANSARCQSNLHQIGIASRMYVDDYHGYPYGAGAYFLQPYVKSGLATGGSGSENAYGSVWICPSYARHGGISGDLNSLDMSYGYNWRGYMGHGPRRTGHGLDAYGGGAAGMLGKPPGTPREVILDQDIVDPSDMIEFGDAPLQNDRPFSGIRGDWDLSAGVNGELINPEIVNGSVPNYKQEYAPSILEADKPYVVFYGQRHGGRWNLVFCDGHVEKNLRPKDVFDTKKPEQMARWNRDHLPHTDPSP